MDGLHKRDVGVALNVHCVNYSCRVNRDARIFSCGTYSQATGTLASPKAVTGWGLMDTPCASLCRGCFMIRETIFWFSVCWCAAQDRRRSTRRPTSGIWAFWSSVEAQLGYVGIKLEINPVAGGAAVALSADGRCSCRVHLSHRRHTQKDANDRLVIDEKNLNENTPSRCMAAVVLEVVLSGAGLHDTPRQD